MKLRKKYKRTYEAWKIMRADYKNPCCKSWQSFARFIDDMGIYEGVKCIVEIIDSTKGYTPGNCRFIHKR